MSTLSPQPPVQPPDPAPVGRYEFATWILGDSVITQRFLAFYVVSLTAIMLISWILAPYIGAIVAAIATVMAGTAAAVRRGRRQSDKERG